MTQGLTGRWRCCGVFAISGARLCPKMKMPSAHSCAGMLMSVRTAKNADGRTDGRTDIFGGGLDGPKKNVVRSLVRRDE